MAKSSYKIGIIGAGGWGTAITVPLAANGHDITLWSIEEDVVREINESHTNETYLSGAAIPEHIKAVNEPSKLANCDFYVNAVPTQYIRPVFAKFTNIVAGKPIINLSKGIEIKSLLRVSEILHDIGAAQPKNYIVLTGPSHAEEVAGKLPTTVTAASESIVEARLAQKIFSTSEFRVYTSGDVIGCEMGGSLKNVIAIAAGIIDGLGMGDNTKAALITRGLAEMTRLGIKLGANPQTFSGLSGLGDLVVTCNSRHSRNRYFGEQIGLGKSPGEIITGTKKIAEGVATTESAYFLGKKNKVELPIVEQMYKIIFDNVSPREAIRDLMARESKHEIWA